MVKRGVLQGVLLNMEMERPIRSWVVWIHAGERENGGQASFVEGDCRKTLHGGGGGSGNGDIEKGTTDNHVCPFVTYLTSR